MTVNEWIRQSRKTPASPVEIRLAVVESKLDMAASSLGQSISFVALILILTLHFWAVVDRLDRIENPYNILNSTIAAVEFFLPQ